MCVLRCDSEFPKACPDQSSVITSIHGTACAQTGAKKLEEIAASTGRTLDGAWHEVFGSQAVKSVENVWETAVDKLDIADVLSTKTVCMTRRGHSTKYAVCLGRVWGIGYRDRVPIYPTPIPYTLYTWGRSR